MLGFETFRRALEMISEVDTFNFLGDWYFISWALPSDAGSFYIHDELRACYAVIRERGSATSNFLRNYVHSEE